jgi:hypothetical protein
MSSGNGERVLKGGGREEMMVEMVVDGVDGDIGDPRKEDPLVEGRLVGAKED